jgi:hypothetical protein
MIIWAPTFGPISLVVFWYTNFPWWKVWHGYKPGIITNCSWPTIYFGSLKIVTGPSGKKRNGWSVSDKIRECCAELCDQHAEKLRIAGDIRGAVGASECAELIRRTSQNNHDQTKKDNHDQTKKE